MSKMMRSGLAAMMAVALITGPSAQTAKPSGKPSNAEYQLVGIRLFDSGAKVIAKYGTPNDILALGSNGGGGGSAGPGGNSTVGGKPSGGGSSNTPSAGDMSPSMNFNNDGFIGSPFSNDQTQWQRQQAGDMSPAGSGQDGRPGGSPGGKDSGGGGAAGGGGTGTSDTIFTKWVYKKGTSQFSFIFDKFNRVVQIEAIGLNDYRVKSRKGIGFGKDFGSIIKKYGAPDGYEVGGSTIVVKYLIKDRIAFRLNRLRAGENHRVTGVVIAAGKG